MDDKLTFTLKSPITDEQWDKITDADFEHTDRIWFETKHGKVEFVKASAQSEIIRCKDCKWKQGTDCGMFAEIYPRSDDFCSRGERRTDE